MLVFIPENGGKLFDKMGLVADNVTTTSKFTLFKIFPDVHVPYESPTKEGVRLKGNVYKVQGLARNITYKGIHLHPVKVNIKELKRRATYIYMLVPLSDLPLL